MLGSARGCLATRPHAGWSDAGWRTRGVAGRRQLEAGRVEVVASPLSADLTLLEGLFSPLSQHPSLRTPAASPQSAPPAGRPRQARWPPPPSPRARPSRPAPKKHTRATARSIRRQRPPQSMARGRVVRGTHPYRPLHRVWMAAAWQGSSELPHGPTSPSPAAGSKQGQGQEQGREQGRGQGAPGWRRPGRPPLSS